MSEQNKNFKHVICSDVYEHIKTLANCSIHTTFSDFPYFLGTQWHYIDGVLQMKGHGKDFMSGSKNSWDIKNADWWRAYFKEIYRVMKYGGYVVFYSISQQSWAFSALMVEAGFEKCQELHWANISNFPKSSDASKAIDNRLGVEREVVGKQNRGKGRQFAEGESGFAKGEVNLTVPASDLAKLFDGYKYGKAPFKKITEPILVFRKPCKNGSVLNDLMECQTDSEISPAVLDIENNRVGVNLENERRKDLEYSGQKEREYDSDSIFLGKNKRNTGLGDFLKTGRFPATLFISPEAAELLDSQLDVVTFELNGKIYTEKRLEYQRLVSLHILNNTFESAKILGVKRESLVSKFGHSKTSVIGKTNTFGEGLIRDENGSINAYKGDSGYISRVLHQPDYNEDDYASLEYAMNDICQYSKGIIEDTIYCPTVSPKERNGGCKHLTQKEISIENEEKEGKETVKSGNSHPTLKPIALNLQVFSLFLLPKEFNQIVYNPFAGAGSEKIGIHKAGVALENIISVEINPDFCAINDARIEYHCKNKPQSNSKPLQTIEAKSSTNTRNSLF